MKLASLAKATAAKRLEHLEQVLFGSMKLAQKATPSSPDAKAKKEAGKKVAEKAPAL